MFPIIDLLRDMVTSPIQGVRCPVFYSVVLSDGCLLKTISYRSFTVCKRTIDVTTNPSENNGDDYLPPPTMGNDSNNVVPDALPLRRSSSTRG